MERENRPLPENVSRYRAAAVTWLAKLDATKAAPLLEKIRENEQDLLVRNAAIQQINNLGRK